MSELQQFPTLASQPFRLDVPLHELLQRPSEDSAPHPTMSRKAETLPAAMFPQHPELFHDLDEQDIAAHGPVVRTGNPPCPPNRILTTIPATIFPPFKSPLPHA